MTLFLKTSRQYFATVAACFHLLEASDPAAAVNPPPLGPMMYHGSFLDPMAHVDEASEAADVPCDQLLVLVAMTRGTWPRLALKAVRLLSTLLDDKASGRIARAVSVLSGYELGVGLAANVRQHYSAVLRHEALNLVLKLVVCHAHLVQQRVSVSNGVVIAAVLGVHRARLSSSDEKSVALARQIVASAAPCVLCCCNDDCNDADDGARAEIAVPPEPLPFVLEHEDDDWPLPLQPVQPTVHRALTNMPPGGSTRSAGSRSALPGPHQRRPLHMSRILRSPPLPPL